MTHISLCSGIGGIDLAAEWAGFESIQFVERDPFCQKVLAKNFPGVPIHDDVTTYKHKGESPSLVSAGFPCQPHSLAGKRLASGDERDLWGEVVRILGEAKPRWFLGENVPGLLTSESGAFFGRVLDDLAALGYRVGWGVWGASDLGACHRRNRVFIVGHSPRSRSNGSPTISGSGRGEGQAGTTSSAGDVADAKGDGRAKHVNQPESKQGPEQHAAYTRNSCDCRGNGDEGDHKGEQGRRSGGYGEESRAGGVLVADPLTIGTGNWREWGISPVTTESELCGSDDGFPRRLHASRLKALGNAVRPAQVYPILQAIADYEPP